MNYIEDLFDPTILNEGFELSTLFVLLEHLQTIKENLIALRDNPYMQDKAYDITCQLFVVNANIDILKKVISNKISLIYDVFHMGKETFYLGLN